MVQPPSVREVGQRLFARGLMGCSVPGIWLTDAGVVAAVRQRDGALSVVGLSAYGAQVPLEPDPAMLTPWGTAADADLPWERRSWSEEVLPTVLDLWWYPDHPVLGIWAATDGLVRICVAVGPVHRLDPDDPDPWSTGRWWQPFIETLTEDTPQFDPWDVEYLRLMLSYLGEQTPYTFNAARRDFPEYFIPPVQTHVRGGMLSDPEWDFAARLGELGARLQEPS